MPINFVDAFKQNSAFSWKAADKKLAVILLSLGLTGQAAAGNQLPPGAADDDAADPRVRDSLIPGQIAGQVNSAFSQSAGQNTLVLRRLFEVRKRPQEELRTSGGANESLTGPIAGGAAGDTLSTSTLLDNRLGLYVTGYFSKGARIATEWEKGFDADNAGVLLGADYRLTDQLVLGTAFGFTDDKSRYLNGQGHLINTGYSGTLYGTYNVTADLYVDGAFTYTHNDYDSARVLTYHKGASLITDSRTSSQRGDQQRLSVGAGYDVPVGAWSFGLRARTEYARVNIDAYGEKENILYSLARVDKQFNDSVLTELGWQISYAYSTPFGVLLPQLNLDWYHEFKNDSREITARLKSEKSRPYTLRTNNPDRDYLVFRAGMSAVLAHGISSFMQYETLLDHRYDTLHTASLGLRWDF